MTLAVLKALCLFYGLRWLATKAWAWYARQRAEAAESERSERHILHRHEQWKRAFANRKAKYDAWVTAMTPEQRVQHEKIKALYTDLLPVPEKARPRKVSALR